MSSPKWHRAPHQIFSVPLKISFSWKVLIEIVRNVWISGKQFIRNCRRLNITSGCFWLTQNVKCVPLRRRIHFECHFLHTTIATHHENGSNRVSSRTIVYHTNIQSYTAHRIHVWNCAFFDSHYYHHSMCFMCANIYSIRRSFYSVPDTRPTYRPSTHPCPSQMHNIMHHLFCETLQIYSSIKCFCSAHRVR